ncbi:MAG: STAS domain-containing protein [Actinomycetota bacterium]|nr:STAS domain-containing protein [Actinomycetota bacterium]
MHNHFRVELRTEDRASVLAVSGELDLACTPELENHLAQVFQSGAKLVIVDLRELEFIDSTGLSVLVKADQQAQEAGCEFGIVNGGTQVRRLLSLTGVTERLRVFDEPDELLSGG